MKTPIDPHDDEKAEWKKLEMKIKNLMEIARQFGIPEQLLADEAFNQKVTSNPQMERYGKQN